MSLRYKFHHLFFGGKVNKKRLYQILEDLDDANGGETLDIKDIKDAIGKARGEGAGGILKDVADIKEDIGTSTSGSETGIHKSIVDINTAIGVSTSGSETGIHKSIVDINTAIGDDDTEGTILGRIKALENANQ